MPIVWSCDELGALRVKGLSVVVVFGVSSGVVRKERRVVCMSIRVNVKENVLRFLRHESVEVDDRTDNQSLHDSMRDPAVRVYGHRGTIHGTELLNVVLDADGAVAAVWFRCQQLPFDVSGGKSAAVHPDSMLPRLVAVEVIDR